MDDEIEVGGTDFFRQLLGTSRFGGKFLNIDIEHLKIKLFYRSPELLPETMYWKYRLSHIHTQTYIV